MHAWALRRLASSAFAARVSSDGDHLLRHPRYEGYIQVLGYDRRTPAMRLAWRARFWDQLLAHIYASPTDIMVTTLTDVPLGEDALVVMDWLYPRDPVAFRRLAEQGNYYGFFDDTSASAEMVQTDRQCNVRSVTLPMFDRQPDVAMEFLLTLFDLHFLLARAAQLYGLISTISSAVYDAVPETAIRIVATLRAGNALRFGRLAFSETGDAEETEAILRQLTDTWTRLWVPLASDARDQTYVIQL